MKNEKIQIEKKYEYIYFARAYFVLAYRGTEEILKKIQTKEYNNPFGEITPDWVYECNYLLVPIFYNVKHAIEISLKGLAQLFGDNLEEKHDLKLLFSRVKGKFTELSPQITKLEKMINRYYQNDFLKDKINNYLIIEDKMNDIFRYPDNKAKVSLEFFQILAQFTKQDVRNIQKDLKEFDELFYMIGCEILKSKYGPPPANY